MGELFSKDILNLVYLCKYYGLDEVADYWHQVIKINDFQKKRFAQKILDYFGGNLKGKMILILGGHLKKILMTQENLLLYMYQITYSKKEHH